MRRATIPLRPEEKIIERFGVSRKYTVLLTGIGAVIIGATLFVRFIEPGVLIAWGEAIGLLGNLVVNGALLASLLLGIYLMFLGLYFQLSFHYFFTTQRVIEAVGLFSDRIVSAEYKSVTDIIVRQDFIGRYFLKTGTLAVNTPGGSHEELVLVNIDNPIARQDQIRGLSEAVLGGRPITPTLMAALKSETGMAITPLEEEESQPVQEPISIAELPKVAQEASPKVSTPPENEIEDMKGDGIDENDRLRNAQKRMQ